MLVGYVSDENYVALAGVDVEFEAGGRSIAAQSRSTGAIYADLEPGTYRVTLSAAGYTGKHVEVNVGDDAPVQFRLLSDRMYGFMWPKVVRGGGSAEYCVHSPEAFRLELWRYGWEKEFIRGFGWCDEHGPRAMTQILPDCDFTQTGVNWNRTGYTLRYQKHAITAPERSGLYMLHATTRGGRFLSFPWLVAPAKPRARMAVLASCITWNAYNSFGGRSNYYSQDALPERPVVNSRQDLTRYTQPDTWPFEVTGAPLSFERPEPASQIPAGAVITDTIAGRTESAFAPGLWRLVGWLEREEFEFDLYADTDLHFGRLPLESYDVLVLDCHPEYWSPEMYQRVKRWVHDEGGKLAYLGACGMYAELEFADESTILCRREGEAELRGESEVNLLGIAYTHSGFQTGAPYRVVDDSHWAFAGTGLKQGDLFGLESLHERCPGGASAHELDKISPDSPEGLQHLAKGTNPENEGADAAIYETHSGGAVFAAGSMCWPLSLPIDEGISAVTRNVLQRFLEK
ncbi:MAG: carboxypeptidase regulatory-like domain-containing protein [Planctomycetota bacterium]|nr:MAG: carboxypeptidase regulatory-like domain-containing protein [Planctomycetota bacterium]REJ94752.1 MAG: carboxypeptidase regulatory-like domain-containing protein [Planctomycetota bacterium]REK29208.1 MAG: carboxypeptidase regulatory-like domain-containing protein [Planctomycetota bacterium]REK29392.1 MAG: carboxypeptidase regulatory-like domain-containing protein [Planctomycetota bacterium]